MWNDEIKQNLIDELNKQLDEQVKAPNTTYENHSYIDSIFPQTTNMFKPITPNFDVPNYYESVITGMRTIKEVPIHTMAFADSFDKNYKQNFSFVYGKGCVDNSSNTETTSESIDTNVRREICDMSDILNCSSAITISLTPEERKVALKPRKTLQDILLSDVDLKKSIDITGAIKRFCSIQVKI